jgi:hypothetical protein
VIPLEVEHQDIKLAILALELAKIKQFLAYTQVQLRELSEVALVSIESVGPIILNYIDDFARKAARLLLLLHYYEPIITTHPLLSQMTVHYSSGLEVTLLAAYQALQTDLLSWFKTIQKNTAEHYEYFESEIEQFKYLITVLWAVFYRTWQDNHLSPAEEWNEISRVPIDQLKGVILQKVRKFQRNE